MFVTSSLVLEIEKQVKQPLESEEIWHLYLAE